jgi:hypothetical protein
VSMRYSAEQPSRESLACGMVDGVKKSQEDALTVLSSSVISDPCSAARIPALTGRETGDRHDANDTPRSRRIGLAA